jgi:hypothetical protein
MTETHTEDRRLPVESNLELRIERDFKTTIQSPKDGYLQCGKAAFRDFAELIEWLGRIFHLDRRRTSAHGTIRRSGKYQRVDGDGVPCFTFGDPVLDLITDKDGVIEISGRVLDLRRQELSDAAQRSGGIRSIDLSSAVGDVSRVRLVDAILGTNAFALCALTPAVQTMCSTSGDQCWYVDNSADVKMRFRAFRKNYWFYKKTGAEIETWGRDFTSASITGRYGVFLGGFCQAVCQDSDSDTNDDYVDEYESSIGVPGEIPDGVRSWCVATWGGSTYSHAVEKGCIVETAGPDLDPC